MRDTSTLSGTSPPGSVVNATVSPLPGRDATTVQTAVDGFLSSPRCTNPNTRRGYTSVLDRLLTDLRPDRALATISGEELADLIEHCQRISKSDPLGVSEN